MPGFLLHRIRSVAHGHRHAREIEQIRIVWPVSERNRLFGRNAEPFAQVTRSCRLGNARRQDLQKPLVRNEDFILRKTFS